MTRCQTRLNSKGAHGAVEPSMTLASACRIDCHGSLRRVRAYIFERSADPVTPRSNPTYCQDGYISERFRANNSEKNTGNIGSESSRIHNLGITTKHYHNTLVLRFPTIETIWNGTIGEEGDTSSPSYILDLTPFLDSFVRGRSREPRTAGISSMWSTRDSGDRRGILPKKQMQCTTRSRGDRSMKKSPTDRPTPR
jgi:hypothetical protein